MGKTDLSKLWDHFDSKRTRRTYDHTRDRFERNVLHVIVGGLDARNFVYVLQADGAIPAVSRFPGAHLYPGRLFEQPGCGWCFCNKIEAAVAANVYLGRRRGPWSNVGSLCVELLAKIHRLDSARAEGGANRRCGCGLASANQETLG